MLKLPVVHNVTIANTMNDEDYPTPRILTFGSITLNGVTKNVGSDGVVEFTDVPEGVYTLVLKNSAGYSYPTKDNPITVDSEHTSFNILWDER